MSDEPALSTFAQRLDHLMRTLPDPDGNSWTNARMSAVLRELGVSASGPYISQLRSGTKTNPAASYVGAFADALSVPVTYFYAQDTSAFDRDMEIVSAIRDPGVKRVAMLARGLGPDELSAIAQLEVSFRQLSGLSIDPEMHGEQTPQVAEGGESPTKE